MKMSREIVVRLNQKEMASLSDKLNIIAAKLDKIGELVTDEIAELGLDAMQQNYSNSLYQDSEGMDFAKTGTKKEKKISMIGVQAVYTEFGTGTEGAMRPHPQKNKFDLRPYNSGKTIRRNTKTDSNASNNGIPIGGLYWTYKDNEGVKHYTQGIPAQKIVYDADEKIRTKMQPIVKKAIEEVLR